MDKQTVRSKIRATKALLTASEKKAAAESVWAMLENTAAFMMSDHILMYHSLADELDTHGLLKKWCRSKRFYLPRVNGVNLDILPFDPDTLEEGAYHIMEPSGSETTPLSTIEMIIVPAVAYDVRGNRVGRGKGFYDRLLADAKAMKVGVGYDFQVVDEIDAEPHDVGVDVVITESRCLRITPKSRKF